MEAIGLQANVLLTPQRPLPLTGAMGGVHVFSQVGIFRVRHQFRILRLLWKLYVQENILLLFSSGTRI